MPKTRAKVLAAPHPVPQSRAVASDFVRRIGEHRRVLVRAEADMNDRIAAIRAEFDPVVAQQTEAEKALLAGLATWCEANRAVLTDDGRVKFADLGAGRVLWRLRPPKVTIKGVEAVIQALKAADLTRFLRTKVEPDREAMLKEADVARTVAGVTIGSDGEDFVVEPLEVALGAAA